MLYVRCSHIGVNVIEFSDKNTIPISNIEGHKILKHRYLYLFTTIVIGGKEIHIILLCFSKRGFS